MGGRRNDLPKERFCFSGTIEELGCWRAFEREAHPRTGRFSLAAMIRAFAVIGPTRVCVAGEWRDDPTKPPEVRFFSGRGMTREVRMRDAFRMACFFLPDVFKPRSSDPSDHLGYTPDEWSALAGDDDALWGPTHRMRPRAQSAETTLELSLPLPLSAAT